MFNRLLVGYDGSERTEDALALAGWLAQIGPGHVTAVCVYGYVRTTRINDRTGAFKDTFADAERTLALLRERVGDEIGYRPLAGVSAPQALQELAESDGTDLIVMGSTARGRLGRTVPGTTAARVLNGAPCAIAVAPLGYRDHSVNALHHIGVAYCQSDEAVAALQVAHDVAQATGAELTVLGAFDPDAYDRDSQAGARETAQQDVNHVLERLNGGVRVRGELIDGPAVEVLLGHAADLDMLVMGSRAHGPIRRAVLGSVSQAVLLDAPCPVLVVPGGATPCG